MIRRATVADAPAIAAIYAAEVTGGIATFETEPPGAAAIAARIAAAGGRYPWLVADEGAALLGYAYAGPYHTRAAYRWSVETTVYVAAGAQGRGMGRALYEALLATLTRQGFTQAVALVSMPNPGSAALHAACGFRQVGGVARVGHKLGRWIDVGHWQRALATPGDPPAEPVGVAEAWER